MSLPETRVQPPPEATDGLSPEELAAQVTLELPDREALSVMIPFGHVTVAATATKSAVAVEDAAEAAPIEEGA
jgi:hypothetical protein